VVEVAVEGHGAVVLGDEALDDGQAGAVGFGREEGIEDAGEVLGGDAP